MFTVGAGCARPRTLDRGYEFLDATRKWKAEGFDRPWAAMIEMDRATKAKIDAIWGKLGL